MVCCCYLVALLLCCLTLLGCDLLVAIVWFGCLALAVSIYAGYRDLLRYGWCFCWLGAAFCRCLLVGLWVSSLGFVCVVLLIVLCGAFTYSLFVRFCVLWFGLVVLVGLLGLFCLLGLFVGCLY